MDFPIPFENEIVDGLYSLNCEIFDTNDVRNFLVTNEPNKKIVDRFISWCVYLRVLEIRRPTWGTFLYRICEDYGKQVSTRFEKNPKDPLGLVDPNVEAALRDDFESHKAWLVRISKECGVPDDQIDFDIRIQRIYALLSFQPEFGYRASLIKIGCVCLAMTAGFSTKVKLHNNFAEAIAFRLARALHSLIPAASLLANQQSLVKYYGDLDTVLLAAAPQTSAILQANGISAISFGINYELVLFAGQHKGVAILNIWDQIIARPERLRDFVACLTVAHVKQFKIDPTPKDIRAAILAQTDWDVEKLIGDAIQTMAHEKGWGESCCTYFCPWLKSFHGYEIRGGW
jgi:hypothetical protein